MTLMEMVARKTNMSRVSTMCMMGDENTRAFLSKLKKGAFAPDESMVEVCGFDPDLEGFEVISLALAMPPKPPVEEEEDADEEKELEQAKQRAGKSPKPSPRSTAATDSRSGRPSPRRGANSRAHDGAQTGKERRTANREAREQPPRLREGRGPQADAGRALYRVRLAVAPSRQTSAKGLLQVESFTASDARARALGVNPPAQAGRRRDRPSSGRASTTPATMTAGPLPLRRRLPKKAGADQRH